MEFSGGYSFDPNTLGGRNSTTMGATASGLVFIPAWGSESKWRLTTGLSFDYKSRQKPVQWAPSMASNGFNSSVDWSTYFLAANFGVNYQSTSWWSFHANAGLGGIVSSDGTVPLTQLPDGRLYMGESSTKLALGYRVLTGFDFYPTDHIGIGPAIGLMGNITPWQVARGPDGCYDGTCIRQKEGNTVDVMALFRVVLQF